MWIGGVLAIAVCLSCTDLLPSGPESSALPEEKESASAAALLAWWERVGRVDPAELTCSPPPRSGREGVRPASTALASNEVELIPSNVRYDASAGLFRFAVRVKNLRAEPIGTADGRTVGGIKVVYTEGVAAGPEGRSGGLGTLVVGNPSAWVNYPRVGQPYHFYETVLGSQEVSEAEEWELRVPAGVSEFWFRVMVFGAAPGAATVPPVAPDSIPSWIYADSNWVHGTSPHMSGAEFINRVLAVEFEWDTPLEEKQAAIDLVGGRVIGGIGTPSTYIIWVADDGSTDQLFEAAEILESLPSVLSVGINIMLDPAYLRPDDSPGWERRDWRLEPDSARGPKWGLDRIAAPFAWGCELGGRKPARRAPSLRQSGTRTGAVDSVCP